MRHAQYGFPANNADRCCLNVLQTGAILLREMQVLSRHAASVILSLRSGRLSSREHSEFRERNSSESYGRGLLRKNGSNREFVYAFGKECHEVCWKCLSEARSGGQSGLQ
eukprot:s1528_g9.t1